jgi:kynurenine formamidase
MGCRSFVVRRRCFSSVVFLTAAVVCAQVTQRPARGQSPGMTKISDHSALIAAELPCYWSAGMAPVVVNHYVRIGPLSAYNSDILVIDEHDGTQWDAPAHFVPKPGSNLPNEGEAGFIFGDKVPVHQFVGEACVIDCTDLLGKGKPGISPLITKDRVQAWEKEHRPLGPGDIVIFRSGWDKFYQPFPAGRSYLADPLAGKAPGWPDPNPDCIHYLVTKKVMNAATDAPSMGPLPGEVALATHVAGLRHGMIWTEGATDLSSLPPTGAFYCMIGPHHVNGSGGEGRALAITGEAAPFLIDAARKQRVADLTVLLAEDRPVWWPGAGVGDHRQPYFAKAFRTITEKNPFFAQTHTMDSHTGTHLVPPAYALPRAGFDSKTYAPDVQNWLAEYEAAFGPRGTSDVTTEKVPLSQTCGWARVIDVVPLVGTTDKSAWPASPEITADHIRRYEAQHGELKPGEIVLFRSGHSDKFFKPFPEGEACIADPLNGKSEGWPAPGAAAIAYLAKKGIRCVGTDGPSLGGANPKQALMTYWSLGSHGMTGVEYLTHLDQLPAKAYFIFAPVKIRDCHGGPGRAIALY